MKKGGQRIKGILLGCLKDGYIIKQTKEEHKKIWGCRQEERGKWGSVQARTLLLEPRRFMEWAPARRKKNTDESQRCH